MTMPDAHDVKVYGNREPIPALPSTITIASPDPGVLAKADQLLEAAEVYVINDDELLEAAGHELAEIRDYNKRLERIRKSVTKPLDDAKARLMALFKPAHEKLLKADAILTNAIRDYRRRIEEERQRLEAEVVERARKERERLEAQAKKLEAKGKVEQAEAARMSAALVPSAVVLPERGQMSAMSTRANWKARVVDKRALIKFVAEHPEYENALNADMPTLNGLARTLKDNMNIPGVVAEPQENFATKGRGR